MVTFPNGGPICWTMFDGASFSPLILVYVQDGGYFRRAVTAERNMTLLKNDATILWNDGADSISCTVQAPIITLDMVCTTILDVYHVEHIVPKQPMVLHRLCVDERTRLIDIEFVAEPYPCVK